jgi:hypothetical protein
MTFPDHGRPQSRPPAPREIDPETIAAGHMGHERLGAEDVPRAFIPAITLVDRGHRRPQSVASCCQRASVSWRLSPSAMA